MYNLRDKNSTKYHYECSVKAWLLSKNKLNSEIEVLSYYRKVLPLSDYRKVKALTKLVRVNLESEVRARFIAKIAAHERLEVIVQYLLSEKRQQDQSDMLSALDKLKSTFTAKEIDLLRLASF